MHLSPLWHGRAVPLQAQKLSPAVIDERKRVSIHAAVQITQM